MKLVRTLSMFIALAGASTVYAQAPKAPAEKKAPAADKAPEKAPEKAPDKAAPPKEEMSPADVKKAEAFFDEFFNSVMKNQDACPKMATAINATLDKHQKWLETVLATGKDVPQATKDKMQKKQQEMMGGMMKCKDDKDVGAAFQRFVGMMMKKKDAAPAAPATKK